MSLFLSSVNVSIPFRGWSNSKKIHRAVSKTSLTQSEAGQDKEEEDAAKCTENNQHVVCGALDMLEQLRVAAGGGRMLRRQPALANVLFLLTFASLRYDPMVRPTIPYPSVISLLTVSNNLWSSFTLSIICALLVFLRCVC